MKIGVALTLAGFSFVMALAGSTFVGTKIVAAHTTIKLGSSEDRGRRTMSHSVSTLLTRNLQDVFGENDPARRAAIDEIYTEDVVFYDPSKNVYRGRDEIASRARSGLNTLTFDISRLPSPRKWAMVGESNGYPAALEGPLHTPVRISSSPGTAGLPPFISSSTNYRERD